MTKTSQDNALKQINHQEYEFIESVIKDMVYDAKGIKIKLNDKKGLINIAIAMAECILSSKN